MGPLLRVLPYAQPYRLLMAGGMLAVIANTVFNLLVPYLIGVAVDEGVTEQNVHALIGTSVLIIVVSGLRGLSAFAQNYLGENAAQGTSYELRKALYAHIQQLSFSFHDQAQTGDLLARATSDVEQLRNFTGRGLLMIFNLVLLVVGVTIAIWSMNWMLALMALAILPLLYWRAWTYSRTIRPMFRTVQDQIARVATLVQDNAAGARVVKAFGREQRGDRPLPARQRRAVRRLPGLDPRAGVQHAAARLHVERRPRSSCSGWPACWSSTARSRSASWSPSTPTCCRSSTPVRRGGFLMSMASRAAASTERILEVLDTPVGVASAPDAVELPAHRGRGRVRGRQLRLPPGPTGARSTCPSPPIRARRSRWSAPPARARPRSPT